MEGLERILGEDTRLPEKRGQGFVPREVMSDDTSGQGGPDVQRALHGLATANASASVRAA